MDDDQKWQAEQERLIAERIHDRDFEANQRTVQAALNNANFAIRTLILINGGTAAAVLAFVGSLATNGEGGLADRLSQITAPLIWFASGVAFGAISSALAYFANYCFASAGNERKLLWKHPWTENTDKSKRWVNSGNMFQVLAVLAALASLVAFVVGVVCVRSAIIGL